MIPVILFNHNRLSTTIKLVKDLHILGYKSIYILDLGSTYQPLLDWYIENDGKSISVIYHSNGGHKAFWTDGIIDRFKEHPWVVISDTDIELNKSTPKGFIENMVTIGEQYKVDKVGLAIRIDNLPVNDYTESVHKIEDRYWTRPLPYPNRKIYDAITDTTFCVVRTNTPYLWGPAIRVAGRFTCIHTPWYLDFNTLSEEEVYYFEHADPRISEHTQRYLQWKQQQKIT